MNDVFLISFAYIMFLFMDNKMCYDPSMKTIDKRL